MLYVYIYIHTVWYYFYVYFVNPQLYKKQVESPVLKSCHGLSHGEVILNPPWFQVVTSP